ncbi:MAG: CBS domain-containing protein [Methyloceanibacter sp.]
MRKRRRSGARASHHGEKQVRRLPVLGEDGKLVGMVSLGDISHALSRERTGEVTKAVSAHHA